MWPIRKLQSILFEFVIIYETLKPFNSWTTIVSFPLCSSRQYKQAAYISVTVELALSYQRDHRSQQAHPVNLVGTFSCQFIFCLLSRFHSRSSSRTCSQDVCISALLFASLPSSHPPFSLCYPGWPGIPCEGQGGCELVVILLPPEC